MIAINYLYVGILALVGHVCGQCFDGWVRWKGSCYGFGEEMVTWSGAASLCRIFDSALAEIDTTEENEFLKSFARNRSYSALWIGGTDVFSEGTFTWITSRRLLADGFTDWGPGEPNHQGGVTSEDCLNMYNVHNYRWNDEDCRETFQFVCETQ